MGVRGSYNDNGTYVPEAAKGGTPSIRLVHSRVRPFLKQTTRDDMDSHGCAFQYVIVTLRDMSMLVSFVPQETLTNMLPVVVFVDDTGHVILQGRTDARLAGFAVDGTRYGLAKWQCNKSDALVRFMENGDCVDGYVCRDRDDGTSNTGVVFFLYSFGSIETDDIAAVMVQAAADKGLIGIASVPTIYVSNPFLCTLSNTKFRETSCLCSCFSTALNPVNRNFYKVEVDLCNLKSSGADFDSLFSKAITPVSSTARAALKRPATATPVTSTISSVISKVLPSSLNPSSSAPSVAPTVAASASAPAAAPTPTSIFNGMTFGHDASVDFGAKAPAGTARPPKRSKKASTSDGVLDVIPAEAIEDVSSH